MGSLAREASWSAERQFRFGPKSTDVAQMDEFRLPPAFRPSIRICLATESVWCKQFGGSK